MKHLYKTGLVLLMLLLTGVITAEAQSCQAAYTYTTAGNTANFTDASTAATGNIISWTWDFGDGNFDNVQNPTHAYSIGGQYIVTLNIFTDAFCFNSFTDTVTVNGGCTASYTYAVDTTSGTVNFQGQPASQSLTYSWNFGDNTTGTGINATHTYAVADTYYVCLTITDTAGFCNDTYCDSVIVNIVPPNCNTTFTFADQGDGNATFTADNFSFTATYDWDFGNNTTGQGAFAFAQYASPGTYYVCLTTTDGTCMSTYCDSITVAADTTCALSFNYFANGFDVGFTAMPVTFSTSISYAWDFGDGNYGAGGQTTHTYAMQGTYMVCVNMIDQFNGCNEIYCDSVTVVDTDVNELASGISSLGSYPNPFNTSTVIQYMLNEKAVIDIAVYDLIGNKVMQIADGEQSAGAHKIEWNAEGLSSGAYLLKVTSSKGSTAKLLIKN